MADRRVIAGGLVLTGPDWVPARRDLLVDAGRIVAVERPGSLDQVDARRHDAHDRLVVPGLINAHTHSHTLPFRGVARDWTLETSLLHGGWMGGERSEELAELCALLAATEMIASGATGVFDLVAQAGGPSAPGLIATARGYGRSGLRAVVAPMAADRSVHEAVPVIGDCCGIPAPGAQSEEILAACLEFVVGVAGMERVTAAVAPTIPAHCTPELMTGLHALAVDHELRMHLHLAESSPQAQAGRERFGHSITAELHRLGLLDDHLTAAHTIWVDQHDRELLAAAGVVVVTVPGSNLRLGSGVADTRALLDAGIGLAVGTDGANSADALDVLDASRLALLLPRVSANQPAAWPTVEEILDAATSGGAAACGWTDVGRITPGHAADLTFLDLSARAFVPANDVAHQLLSAARAADVTDVMVDGDWVYRDRAFGHDLATATDRFTELTAELHDRLAPVRAKAADEAVRAAGPLANKRRAGVHLVQRTP